MKNLFQKSIYLHNLTVEEEVLDWYEMTEAERFAQSQDLWEIFVLFGGVYDPEPDTQSPFNVFKS